MITHTKVNALTWNDEHVHIVNRELPPEPEPLVYHVTSTLQESSIPFMRVGEIIDSDGAIPVDHLVDKLIYGRAFGLTFVRQDP